MQVTNQNWLLVPQNSRTEKPPDPETHLTFDLLTGDKDHRREADSIQGVPLQTGTELDTRAVLGTDMTRRQRALPGTGATGWARNASDVVGTTRQKTVHWIIGGRNVFWDAIFTIK